MKAFWSLEPTVLQYSQALQDILNRTDCPNWALANPNVSTFHFDEYFFEKRLILYLKIIAYP